MNKIYYIFLYLFLFIETPLLQAQGYTPCTFSQKICSESSRYDFYYGGYNCNCCHALPGSALVDKWYIYGFCYFGWESYQYSYYIPAGDAAYFYQQWGGNCEYCV
ncbi:MAG: hypothetical protein R2822_25865 [Spirosomataceae bacterium]